MIAATSTLYFYQESFAPSVVYAKEAGVDLGKVREAIVGIIDSDAEKRSDGSSMAGTFIRMAW